MAALLLIGCIELNPGPMTSSHLGSGRAQKRGVRVGGARGPGVGGDHGSRGGVGASHGTGVRVTLGLGTGQPRGLVLGNVRTKGLRFAALNVRSAVNKAAEIHDTIECNNTDVLLLSETWITRDAPPAIKLDIAPPGFSVRHVHRTCLKSTGRKAGQTKGGGGGGGWHSFTAMISS